MKKYFRHNIKNFVAVRNIITIEYLELDTAFTHQRETHNFWELAYVDCGKMQYIVQDNETAVQEGEVIFLSPQQSHEIHADPYIPANIFVLCFDCVSPSLHALSNMKVKLSAGEKAFLRDIMSETRGTFRMPFCGKLQPLENPNLGGEQAIKLYLELFLIMMLRRSSKESSFRFVSDSRTGSEVCVAVIDYMKSKLHSGITVAEICDAVAYSKSAISRVFKQQTGKSMIAYYNELKMDEAKKLIRETAQSMSAISDILGFSDPRYFNIVFKQIVHMTPKQYRDSIHS